MQIYRRYQKTTNKHYCMFFPLSRVTSYLFLPRHLKNYLSLIRYFDGICVREDVTNTYTLIFGHEPENNYQKEDYEWYRDSLDEISCRYRCLSFADLHNAFQEIYPDIIVLRYAIPKGKPTKRFKSSPSSAFQSSWMSSGYADYPILLTGEFTLRLSSNGLDLSMPSACTHGKSRPLSSTAL